MRSEDNEEEEEEEDRGDRRARRGERNGKRKEERRKKAKEKELEAKERACFIRWRRKREVRRRRNGSRSGQFKRGHIRNLTPVDF